MSSNQNSKTVQISHIVNFSKSIAVCVRPEQFFEEFESCDLDGGYDIIAEIECKGDDTHSILEDAFEKSNHINSNWLEGSDVKNIKKMSARSSFSGDLFMIDGTFYLVDMVGFKKVNMQDKTLEEL